ncbi:MAG: PGPGW domain-containing protein [Mycobacteriales bacterium]
MPDTDQDRDSPSSCDPSVGAPVGWRARLRRTPGGTQLLQVLVFVAGLLFILLGLALAALPGPLTIPPILVGVYIWSTEFAWADRLLERAKKRAREAWGKAKKRPVLSALVTVGGLIALGVGIYLVSRFDLVARGTDLIGL